MVCPPHRSTGHRIVVLVLAAGVLAMLLSTFSTAAAALATPASASTLPISQGLSGRGVEGTPMVSVPSAGPSLPTTSGDCGHSVAAQEACAAARASLAHAPRGAPTWNLTCTPCTISARFEAGMVYDAADGYVLLFGGLTVSDGTLGDTWTYKAGNWTNITATACPSGCPPPRFGMGMAYDAADGYVVMFGGAFYNTAGNDYYDDTWTFSGGTWTQVDQGCSPSVTCPSKRYYPAMTYDAADGYVLLFGGAVLTVGALDDTWSYVGGTWTLISLTGGPAGREASGMAYDPPDHEVVLFGGIGGSNLNTYFSDTWTFAGGSWSQLSPASAPSARGLISFELEFDTAANTLLLFGGETSSTIECDDETWTFSAGSWTQLSINAGPTARFGAMLSNDPADGTLVLFGGLDCNFPYTTLDDSWTYYAGFPPLTASLTATPTATDVGSSVSFSAVAYGGFPPFAYLLRYGDGSSATALPTTHTYAAPGKYLAWLWVNDSSGASVTSTALVTINALPTASASASPNPVDVGVPATFSGGLAGGTAPFTYSWNFGDGTSATAAAPTHAYGAPATFMVHFWSNDSLGKPATSSFTMTVHTRPAVTLTASPATTDVGVPVKFTASPTGGIPPYVEAWRFGDGAAGTGLTPSHAYASRGNYTVVVWANDSGGGSASASLSIRVNAPVGVSAISATPDPSNVGVPVAFSATFWGGTPSYLTTWHFGTGVPSTSTSPTFTFVTTGSYTVRLWVNDSVGGDANTSVVVTVGSVVPLVISSFQGNFTRAAPGTLDLGQPLGTLVVAHGGLSPLSYSYTGLPGGCASVDLAWLSCIPSATGSYQIQVQVTDALGHSAFANLSLVVDPAVALPGFGNGPSQVSLGAGILLGVPATGGDAPYTYDYLLLPTGCSSANVSSLACYPTVAGTYHVELQATDLADQSAFGNATITVNSDPTIRQFQVSPANATVGETVSIVVVASGGTGALTYLFTGVPPGCPTPSSNGAVCHPTTVGNYVIRLTVRDVDGREANLTRTLNVAPAPNVLLTLFENYWWGWIILAAIAALLIYLAIDRRHRRLTNLDRGDEIGGIAPAPEGHALVEDTIAGPAVVHDDAEAPAPGLAPPGYEHEPAVPPPPSAVDVLHEVGTVPPSPPAEPPAPSSATAPSEGSKWVAVPLSPASSASEAITSSPGPGAPPVPQPGLPTPPTTSSPPSTPAPALPGTPPAAAKRIPGSCMICNTPLGDDHYCVFCHVNWG